MYVIRVWMFERSEGAITSLVQGSNAGLKGPNYEPYMLVVSMRYVRTGNSMRVHVCVGEYIQRCVCVCVCVCVCPRCRPLLQEVCEVRMCGRDLL